MADSAKRKKKTSRKYLISNNKKREGIVEGRKCWRKSLERERGETRMAGLRGKKNRQT